MRHSRGVFAASCAGGASAVGILAGRARAADIRIKLAHTAEISHPVGVGSIELAQAVRKASRGRVEIEVFGNGILGMESPLVSQLRVGGIEMSIMGSAPLAAVSPVTNMALVAYAFKEDREIMAAIDGDLGNIIRQDLETRGIVAFQRGWGIGFRQMANNLRPIARVEDMAGLKMRVAPSPISFDMFRELGASPVVSGSDFYTLLQTHVVDGADAGAYPTIASLRLYEVLAYLSITNHAYTCYLTIANANFWKSLPADVQSMIRAESDAVAMRQRRFAAANNLALAEKLVRLGMKRNIIADPAPFRARLANYYAHWKSEFGAARWSTLERYCGRLG